MPRDEVIFTLRAMKRSFDDLMDSAEDLRARAERLAEQIDVVAARHDLSVDDFDGRPSAL